MERLLRSKLDAVVRENSLTLAYQDEQRQREIDSVQQKYQYAIDKIDVQISELQAQRERQEYARDRQVLSIREGAEIVRQAIMEQEKGHALEYATALLATGKLPHEVRQALDDAGNGFHLFNATRQEVMADVMAQAGVAE